jgi:hypothetical protein
MLKSHLFFRYFFPYVRDCWAKISKHWKVNLGTLVGLIIAFFLWEWGFIKNQLWPLKVVVPTGGVLFLIALIWVAIDKYQEVDDLKEENTKLSEKLDLRQEKTKLARKLKKIKDKYSPYGAQVFDQASPLYKESLDAMKKSGIVPVHLMDCFEKGTDPHPKPGIPPHPAHIRGGILYYLLKNCDD